jgi:hypothetical protein
VSFRMVHRLKTLIPPVGSAAMLLAPARPTFAAGVDMGCVRGDLARFQQTYALSPAWYRDMVDFIGHAALESATRGEPWTFYLAAVRPCRRVCSGCHGEAASWPAAGG